MHEDDGDGADAVVVGRLQQGPRRFPIQRAEHRAVRHHALVHLDHAFVEHRGQHDLAVEELGPGLVADAERVGEARRRDQQRAIALALQQRVGRDRRAHLDHVDLGAGDRRAGGDAHQLADALDGGVAVVLRVLREQLARHQRAVGAAPDDVGEGPAPVDPELPTRLGFSHDAMLPLSSEGWPGGRPQSTSAISSPALTGPSLMTAA